MQYSFDKMNAESDIPELINVVVDEVLDDPYLVTGGHHLSNETVIYFKKLGRVVLFLLTTSVVALITNLLKS